MNIDQYELAAKKVKTSFPWAKIIWTEAAEAVLCVGTPYPCPYEQSHQKIQSVGWIGVAAFSIDPRTDDVYQGAIARMKADYPGRSWLDVADGWWEPVDHGNKVGPITVMGDVLEHYYEVASTDSQAVLLGIFIWDRFGEGTSSMDFPAMVLQKHIAIGRQVTGRTRAQQYMATGLLESVGTDGCIEGWACDPDAAWSESITVQIFSNGAFQATLVADQPGGVAPQCRTGLNRRFRTCLTSASKGRITAVAWDLDSGSTVLPSACPDSPGCYTNFFLPIGYFDGISSTGWATGWTCDQDAAAVSISVQFTADGVLVGTYPTNLGSEAAVNSQCGGGTVHRWGVQLPAWTKGKAIRAFGLDKVSGSKFLPSSTCSNRICYW